MTFNPLNLVPETWRIEAEFIAAGVAVALLAGGVGWFIHHERDIGRAEVQALREADRVALQDEVQKQRGRNMELQRAAELNYTVVAEVRERLITRTITEVRDATPKLAACPVGAAGVVLLNRAADCARSDSASACGASEEVRSP